MGKRSLKHLVLLDFLQGDSMREFSTLVLLVITIVLLILAVSIGQTNATRLH